MCYGYNLVFASIFSSMAEQDFESTLIVQLPEGSSVFQIIDASLVLILNLKSIYLIYIIWGVAKLYRFQGRIGGGGDIPPLFYPKIYISCNV